MKDMTIKIVAFCVKYDNTLESMLYNLCGAIGTGL